MRATLVILAAIFSLTGFFHYGRFVYILEKDPGLSVEQLNKKYFSHFPAPLNGIHQVNVFILIVLSLSVFCLLLFMKKAKLRKGMRILLYSWIILDGLVLSMVILAYM